MAIASFCGMEICTGLAESCFPPSLLRDRRNCSTVSASVHGPRSVAPYPRRTFTIAAGARAVRRDETSNN